jgi:hypothetical protein
MSNPMRTAVTCAPLFSAVACVDSETPSALPRVAKRLSIHAVCVAAYRVHRDSGIGLCQACGQVSPCRVSGAAIVVIRAHADDPRRYDDPERQRVRMVAGVAAAPRVSSIG